MEENKLVSILVNCYNGEEFLKECLDSILNQTYTNWEIIFWDNQSTDKSATIFKSYNEPRFKYYYSQIFTNLYTARNLALEKTSGSYVAFLDVDDYWMADKLELQIDSMYKNGAVICAGNYYNLLQENNEYNYIEISNSLLDNPLKNILKSNFIGMFTILVQKKVLLENSSAFNSNYHIIGDFEMLVRILSKYKINWIHKPLGTYRIHGNNESLRKRNLQIEEEVKWMLENKINKNISELDEFKYYSDLRWYQYLLLQDYNIIQFIRNLNLIHSDFLKLKILIKWCYQKIVKSKKKSSL
ncbi:MAG: glycosyltransferase [Chitinophagaceae bacterium]|nr:glycosyltransferase [Chitinophagaceae bacterium]